MHLSIIIPAYNEEKNLIYTINEFNKYLRLQKYSYEMIIVNDGSTDRTVKIAEELIKKIKNLYLINNIKNKGKGAVVKQGLLKASGRYRLFIDADNATSIDHIDKIWKHFKNGSDVVIGVRHSNDADGACQKIKQPIYKRFLGSIGNYIIQFLTIRGIRDTQCGFKVFSEKAIQKIVPKIKINRWMFDVEMLILARKNNFKIAKIPVIWKNSQESRVGIKGYFISLKEILKIKLNIILKKY